jgi:hypothetical protein
MCPTWLPVSGLPALSPGPIPVLTGFHGSAAATALIASPAHNRHRGSGVQMFINQRWLGIPDQKIQFRTRDR